MILLFDVYNIAFASHHALSKQLNPEQPQDAALFGTIKTILARVSEVYNFQFIFLVFDNAAWENGVRVPSWRHEMYPNYKASRNVVKSEKDRVSKEMTRSAVTVALDELRMLSTVLPVWVAERYNTEADDLIASLAQTYSSMNVPVQIISGDKDMRQLVNPYTSVWTPAKKSELTHSLFGKVCTTKDGILIPTPEAWLLFRMLMGDPSDDIKGIPGFGEKSAAKAVVQTIEHMNQCNQDHDMSTAVMAGYLIENAAKVLGSGDIRGWKGLAQKLMMEEHQKALLLNYNLMNLGPGSMAQSAEVMGTTAQWCSSGAYDRNTVFEWLTGKAFNSIVSQFSVFDTMFERVGKA